MKKIYRIAFLLTMFFLLSVLCSCAQSESQQPEEKKKNIVVGFSQIGSESSWRVANSESMKRALSEENGYELIFDDAKQKQENQYKAIRRFILQEVDYIVLAPITEDGWDDVLLEAKNANIPVIIVDRQVNCSDKLYTTWIGSDFFKEGEYAAKWLESQLEEKDSKGEKVNILHLMGTVGGTAQIGRSNGLYKFSRNHDNWNITELQGEYTEAKSYELTKNLLQTTTDFDVVYCENDNMAFGVMRAFREMGVDFGPESDMIIISFDAVKSAMEQCLEGNIDLCVECNPLHGPRVAKIIEQLQLGMEVNEKTYVEETVFSSDSITKEIIDARKY